MPKTPIDTYRYNGAPVSKNFIKPESVHDLIYDGSHWLLKGEQGAGYYHVSCNTRPVEREKIVPLVLDGQNWWVVIGDLTDYVLNRIVYHLSPNLVESETSVYIYDNYKWAQNEDNSVSLLSIANCCCAVVPVYGGMKCKVKLYNDSKNHAAIFLSHLYDGRYHYDTKSMDINFITHFNYIFDNQKI